jgi:hypothetical protein
MSSQSNKILPYPISANASILSSTKQKEAVRLYYTKILAIYYIDLMYDFIDTLINCSIGILTAMDIYMGYIKSPVLFTSTILSKLINLNNKIVKERYVYVEKHYKIIDVNAEKEVFTINFLERKRKLSNFMENGSYYKELQNVMVKRDEVKKQFTVISGILNNVQFNDDIKEQKIHEYINKKNKGFVNDIESRLKFIPLESIEQKLISIEKIIVTLEKCFSDNWSENGKKAFDEYKRYIIEKKETEGGRRKSKRNKKIIKGGVFGNFFSRFTSKKVGIVPVNYIAIVNKYKNVQNIKLKNLYDFIEEIVFYSLYHINIAHVEYKYLNNPNSRYLIKENGVSKIIKLNNTERDYLYMSNSQLQHNINHNFKILKGRYTEHENKISMSFPDELVEQIAIV